MLAIIAIIIYIMSSKYRDLASTMGCCKVEIQSPNDSNQYFPNCILQQMNKFREKNCLWFNMYRKCQVKQMIVHFIEPTGG